MIDKLTDENFLLYAAQNYDNPNCVDILEFYDDLNRIKYIKRLFKKYLECGEIKERLVINHLITLYNVFPHPSATYMLIFKLSEYLSILKPFLMLLNYWPDKINTRNTIIHDSDVQLDMNIVKLLRQSNGSIDS